MKKKKHSKKNSSSGAVLLVLGLAVAALAVSSLFLFSGVTRPSAVRPGGLMVAKVAFVDGDLELAEELARDFVEMHPGMTDAEVFLGRVLLERGRTAEAREIFTRVMKAAPENFHAVRGMAKVYEALGQPELAVVYYHRAAELKKDDPKVWRDLAQAQENSGDGAGAMSSLQQALSIDPGAKDISALLAKSAMGNGQMPMIPGMPAGNTGFSHLPKPVDPRTMIPGVHTPDPSRFLPSSTPQHLPGQRR